jgi:hypothetical protein
VDRTPLFVCSVRDGGAMVRPWQGNLRECPSNPTDLRTATLLQCHQELACPPGSGPERRSRSVMSFLNCAPSECRGHLDRARHSPAHMAKPSWRFPTASKRSRGSLAEGSILRVRRSPTQAHRGDGVGPAARSSATKERVHRWGRSWVAQASPIYQVSPINYAILFFGHFCSSDQTLR